MNALLQHRTPGSGPLPDGGEGCSSKGIDQERLALLERQAPAFIILDFRWGGRCWEGDFLGVKGLSSNVYQSCRAHVHTAVLSVSLKEAPSRAKKEASAARSLLLQTV